jgi:hypothetical protein
VGEIDYVAGVCKSGIGPDDVFIADPTATLINDPD